MGIAEGMGIADAASVIGLTAHTLRYYERIGLAVPPPRGSDGRRRYTEANLDWLRLVTRLRSTGMPVADMCRYAELVRDGPGTAVERRELLQAHRETVRQRIAELRQDLAVIDGKIETYYAMEAAETAAIGQE
jgi:DNA-binding transcriptional MerR regulator